MYLQGTVSTIGKFALLFGALAAIMTTVALISKQRNTTPTAPSGEFDGWEDSLGV